MAYETGRRIVEMANEDLRPSKILTREAFLNAIVVNTAIGGSTNAQPHIMAMARHAGADLSRPTGTTATTCRCSSTCSPRANTSASASTAPAACPPSSTSSCKRARSTATS